MAATIQIDKLLQTVVNRKASDLHICVGQPPVVRVDGHLPSSKRRCRSRKTPCR